MSEDPTSHSVRTVGLHAKGKSLLRNVIRHVDTHNRLKEEASMWQHFYNTRQLQSQGKTSAGTGSAEGEHSSGERRDPKASCHDDSESKDTFRDLKVQHSFLYDDRQETGGYNGRYRGYKRAHMDDVKEHNSIQKTVDSVENGSSSTFWLRQLHKAEEDDPDRWGHAGYKELYPDDYNSDRSESPQQSSGKRKRKMTSKGEKSAKKKMKKRKKTREHGKKIESKHDVDNDGRSKEKRSKRKKERKERNEDRDSESRKKKRKKRKHKESEESNDSSASTNDENHSHVRHNFKFESEREKLYSDSSHRKKRRKNSR